MIEYVDSVPVKEHARKLGQLITGEQGTKAAVQEIERIVDDEKVTKLFRSAAIARAVAWSTS
ncbi:MAG TPA: hypothetical protein VEC35_14275 [Noviherbaspirillum sp.]|nr:hypothetical protein [Noviherbaspirillum sp.]